MPLAIKICGLKDEQAVQAVIAAKADYAGFIHFPASPRHVSLERAAKLKALLPASIRSVSVMVDPDDALLAHMQTILAPDYLQLHGKETPDRLRAIRHQYPALKIIKAISVRTGDDVAKASQFTDSADLLMFDAKAPAESLLPGGNGLSFDWALLKDRTFPLPWFLSGGLNIDNIAEAISHTGAVMLDVSSGVERSPGVKDATLIHDFVTRARAAYEQ